MPVDDDGEIAPKAQRDKQLCHDKHWSEQKMGRIVDQCRLPSLEHPVPNNLRCGSALPDLQSPTRFPPRYPRPPTS